jgi:hypothetical protein
MENGDSIKANLSTIFIEIKSQISNDAVELIHEFIIYGEWGLAYETICDQIYENDIQISQLIFDRILETGKLMHIDKSVWTPLEKLINKDKNEK